MNDLKEKERKAIEALKMFEPEDEPYYQGQTTFEGFDILDV